MRNFYLYVADKLGNFIWGRALVGHFRRHAGLYENIEAMYIALILALFIKAYLIEAYKIPSASMHDTLLEGDRIFVNKMAYTFEPVQPGDVIVFRTKGIPPIEDPEKQFYIKRVVGLPGDLIEIRNGDLYRNGLRVTDPPIFRDNYYTTLGDGRRAFHVPEGQVYVFGDNSFNSFDSRAWGGVPIENIVGKAVFRYFPLARIGRIRGAAPDRAKIYRNVSTGADLSPWFGASRAAKHL
ncbi:MAG: signal peptidase I [bacterium]|nr:signal peptidase I [bacterium]